MQTQWSAFCPYRSHTSSACEWVWRSHSIVCVFIRTCVLHKGISSLIDALWVGGGSEIALQSVSILFPAPLSSIFFLFLFADASIHVLHHIFNFIIRQCPPDPRNTPFCKSPQCIHLFPHNLSWIHFAFLPGDVVSSLSQCVCG